jgi:hypothetical protein
LEAAVFLNFSTRIEREILNAIRPCRESTSGWTPGAVFRVNHNSKNLNEHGSALTVFCPWEFPGWALAAWNS